MQSYSRDRTDIPVMLLGLKRDLRKEEPGVIFPQEVSQWVGGCGDFGGRWCMYVCEKLMD